MLEHNLMQGIHPLAGFGPFALAFFALLAIWSIVWKGIALWIAAREGHKPWFIILLILNTAGILEIIYIIFFSKRGGDYIADWRKKRPHTTEAKHAESKGDTSSAPTN